MTLTALQWDSDFFGVPIGRADIPGVSVAEALAAAHAEGLACVYMMVPAIDRPSITAAIHAGARLVALRQELRVALPLVTGNETGTRLATKDDRHALYASAESLASFSRFAADPRFALARVEDMYRIWVDRCLEEGAVAVAPDEAGFVAITTHDDVASVALVHVAPHAAGRGLGRALIRAALAPLATKTATVATDVSNIAALRLYQSVGFRTDATTAILHLWTDEQRRD